MISDERLKELGDDNTICKVSWDERVGMARELLALRKAHAIPEGWKLVPVEPTGEMCEVQHIGVDVFVGMARDECYSIGGADAANLYKAMLAAAPEPE